MLRIPLKLGHRDNYGKPEDVKQEQRFTRLHTFLNPEGDSLDNLLKDNVFFCLKDSKVMWELTTAGTDKK